MINKAVECLVSDQVQSVDLILLKDMQPVEAVALQISAMMGWCLTKCRSVA